MKPSLRNPGTSAPRPTASVVVLDVPQADAPDDEVTVEGDRPDRPPKGGRTAHRLTQVWVLRQHWRQVRMLAALSDETASDFVRRAIKSEIARIRTKNGMDGSRPRRRKIEIK